MVHFLGILMPAEPSPGASPGGQKPFFGPERRPAPAELVAARPARNWPAPLSERDDQADGVPRFAGLPRPMT